MSEDFIVQTLVIGLIAIFGMVALKMAYSLLIQDKLQHKVNGLLTEVGKIKTSLKRMGNTTAGSTSHPTQGTSGTGLPDVANMTLEDAAEMIGIDAKDLNNPIIRPIAEKIFAKIKEGQEGNTDESKPFR